MEILVGYILWWFTPLHFPFYVLFGFIYWYLVYGGECALNGGSIGRNPLTMPFVLFKEEFFWSIPGGRKKKAEVIKEMVGEKGGGAFCTRKRTWQYEEIREGNLLEQLQDDKHNRQYFQKPHLPSLHFVAKTTR